MIRHTWLLIVFALFAFGWFVYTIYMRLSGRPLPRFSWERKLNDRQLWTIKIIVLAALAIIAIVIIVYR